MIERVLRLVLISAVLAVLFSPWRQPAAEGLPAEGIPTWLLIPWFTWEFLWTGPTEYVTILKSVCILLSLWAVPFLLPVNVGLAVRRPGKLKRWLKAGYRVFLPVALLSSWYTARLLYQSWRGAGFWGYVLVIFLAALFEFTTPLVEVALLRKRHLEKAENASPAVE